ncbi:MAG TPA: hypothetical protein VM145_02055 [Sphingomicrobium sp.]|nr:hypothetical protein [Sphingomicrobium sp.]
MRRLLPFFLLAAGCTQGPDDLGYISQARSLAAQWALINEQASAGRLTDGYVQAMRKTIRQQLQTSSSSLTVPGSRYAQEIDALLAQPDDSAPDELRAYAERLKQIEDKLESA